ncbi:MAG: hypothetical protein ABIH86_02910 [Planctomycetota bacterium]
MSVEPPSAAPKRGKTGSQPISGSMDDRRRTKDRQPIDASANRNRTGERKPIRRNSQSVNTGRRVRVLYRLLKKDKKVLIGAGIGLFAILLIIIFSLSSNPSSSTGTANQQTDIIPWNAPKTPPSSTSDDDKDGMLDVWEDKNGLKPFFIMDAFEDPDGDGAVNIHEFIMQTDPQSNVSVPSDATDRSPVIVLIEVVMADKIKSVAKGTTNPTLNLPITLKASATHPEPEKPSSDLKYDWDFNAADGLAFIDASGSTLTFSGFSARGVYLITLRVTAPDGSVSYSGFCCQIL